MTSDSQQVFFIVMPSFNQDRYLGEAIDSVLSQMNVDVFLRVVDGGSTDSSVEILKKYGKKISWISEKDKGQVDAINKGIKFFKDKIKQEKINPRNVIFAYLNSDDFYYKSTTFEAVAQQFASSQYQWCVGDAVIVNEDGKEIQSVIRWYKRVLRNLFGSFLFDILNPIPQPATFLRWNALEKTGLFNTTLNYTMDYEYWLRIKKIFGLPIFLNTPIAAFRIHSDSKGVRKFAEQFKEEYEVAKQSGAGNIALLLHSFHSFFIVTIYKILK